ncbi:MAG TPA: SMP-30/gluconolactonase/LRE family protein, partial [Solirubrobacterales bacterium]|nr:SMP-30/gluconolactonase/LRE family protein [Solirubrobacterales bacterium]
PFVQFDPEVDGFPDGLCIDVEGGVWVAMCRGGSVRRYDADGSHSAQVDVGCSAVTACSFGGPDRETLFVTTARADDPLPGDAGGALFAARPGVAGLPLHAYDPR